MTMPAPLAALVNVYNQTVAQFQAGACSQEDAFATLAASTVHDQSGAVWSVAPAGHFLRAAAPGLPPEPADPERFVSADVPQPPQPMFPALIPTQAASGPAYGIPQGYDRGLDSLDTPPMGAAPIPPIAETPAPVRERKAARVRSLSGERRTRFDLTGKIRALLAANRWFAAIVVVGVILVAAAVVVPRVTAGHHATGLPSSSTANPTMPVTAPVGASTAPSTSDAAAVVRALGSGDPAKIQAVVATPLDAPTSLRVQALWKGLADTKVTITPGPAAASAAKAATGTWTITRDGEKAPVVTLTVNWVSDGTAWKLATAPTF